jgi:hypothetical protein
MRYHTAAAAPPVRPSRGSRGGRLCSRAVSGEGISTRAHTAKDNSCMLVQPGHIRPVFLGCQVISIFQMCLNPLFSQVWNSGELRGDKGEGMGFVGERGHGSETEAPAS